MVGTQRLDAAQLSDNMGSADCQLRSSGSDSGEDEDEGVSVSHVGEGLSEIPAHLAAVSNLEALCLHGNSIQHIQYLEGLCRLVDLNLSSNCLVAVEGLRGLAGLTALNLSSNSLTTVEGLEALPSLRRLNLSHNNISSLQGLSVLHGGPLEVLDLRNNAIGTLHEFSVLAGCPNLAELLVEGGAPGNPVCQQPAYHLAITAALPQLRVLDRRPVNPAEAVQYLAAMRLQAFQPLQPPPAQLLLTDSSTGAASVGSPLRSLGPPGANSMASPQLPQFSAQPAAASQPPFQRIQDVLSAEEVRSRSPARTTIPDQGGQLWSQAGSYSPQQPSMPVQAAAADPEQQLAHLLDSFPQLVGPLIKALRYAEGGAHGVAVAPSALVAATQRQPSSPRAAAAPPPPPASVADFAMTVATKHAVAVDGAGTGPHCCTTSSSVQTEAEGELIEQLQARVQQLQDEVEALHAELEVNAQAAARGEKEAGAKVLQAAQQAESQIREIEQQASAAVRQSKQELAAAKERCKSLEALLADSQHTQAAGLQRQHDLEYELGRAWEELERMEAALQHQRAQHEVAMQQLEAQLCHARREAQERAVALGEATSRQDMLQRQLADQQALVSKLHSERDASERSSSQRSNKLQQQLEATRVQLQQQGQRLQEVQARESEAHQQLKQLSATLSSVHEEHDAAVATLRHQQEQELRDIAAERMAAVSAALEERDVVQRQLAATEAEFRCALQEGAKECGDMRRDLELLAAETVELRRALQEEHHKRKEAEGMVTELTEVVQHQKLRMRGLAQEKADVSARLAAMNPQELERVRGELLTLRERAGELGAIRDQLLQERRLAESLQQRLAMAQQQLVDARDEATRSVAAANAALRSTQEEASMKIAAAETAASEAGGRAEQLSEEASRLRDAVKYEELAMGVKEAMLDSANERIAELRTVAAAAQAAADEARLVAEEAEEELRSREGSDSDRQHSLRAEIEAQEGVIEALERKLGEAERRLKDAEKRAAAAEAAAAEKESMISYVGEEVERVKTMFEQKEARLAQERDAARKEASQLRGEHETLEAMVQQLEASMRELSAQLQAEQAKAASAAQAARMQEAEAARCSGRVAEVEEELREVLGTLEAHKAASAAKFQQLQSVLADMQNPFLQLQL